MFGEREIESRVGAIGRRLRAASISQKQERSAWAHTEDQATIPTFAAQADDPFTLDIAAREAGALRNNDPIHEKPLNPWAKRDNGLLQLLPIQWAPGGNHGSQYLLRLRKLQSFLQEYLWTRAGARGRVAPMSQSTKLPVWRLKSGADRRFRAGHPWVYSNELQQSPKGIEPGEAVELCDAGGKFLARGVGHPHSLIAFRALSRDEENLAPHLPEAILSQLLKAASLRDRLGLTRLSHRLCFGEADGLPGLIVDRYQLKASQVFVLQAHAAGMERWVIPHTEELLRSFVEKQRSIHNASGYPTWESTAIVIRNDAGARKLEGLEEQEPRVLRAGNLGGESALSEATIRVPSALGWGSGLQEFEEFSVNLLRGQKTGFFLDQSFNLRLAAGLLSALRPESKSKPLRVLDLCSYVGQWSAQLAQVFRKTGHKVEVVAVDASAGALELARQNIEARGARCQTLKGDVLKDLKALEDRSFDLVISDPPALIKGRKDIPVGSHAYLQLNTEVFRLVRNQGAVISCSCSSLLEEEEFLKILSKAAYRNRRSVRWVGRGGQAPDHPILAEFPEGRYLKAWVGLL